MNLRRVKKKGQIEFDKLGGGLIVLGVIAIFAVAGLFVYTKLNQAQNADPFGAEGLVVKSCKLSGGALSSAPDYCKFRPIEVNGKKAYVNCEDARVLAVNGQPSEPINCVASGYSVDDKCKQIYIDAGSTAERRSICKDEIKVNNMPCSTYIPSITDASIPQCAALG